MSWRLAVVSWRAWVRSKGGDGFERMVWVWSEGEEMCWFARILVWERIGFVF